MKDDLNAEGKKLFDSLAEKIPNFHPVLDEMFLTVYVMQIQGRDRLLAELEKAETEQEKGVLEDILKEEEKQLMESAKELGLTPSSRKEIKRNLRLRKKLGIKGWWE